MNLQDLENILREEGAQDLPVVDTEQLWQRVEPHIPKEKKRRGLFRWQFFLGLFFFTIALASILLYQNDTLSETVPDYVVLDSQKENSNDSNKSSINKIEIGSSNSQDKPAINSRSKVQNISKFEKNNQIASNQNGNASTVSFGQNEIHKDVNVSQYSENIKSVNQRTETASLFSATSSIRIRNVNQELTSDQGLIKSSANFELDLPSTINLQNSTHNESNNINQSNKKTPFQFDTNTIKENKKRFIPPFSNTLESGTDGTNLNQMHMALIGHKHNLTVESLLDNEFSKQPKITPYKNSKISNRWMMSLGAGSFSTNKNLSLVSNSRLEDFTNREASESVLDAWNVNLSIYYAWHPNLSWSLGLDYSWINEESISALITQNQIELEQVVVAQIIDGNTVENVFARNVLVNQTIEKRIRRINTYKWIDIPLEIIYSSQLSNQISFDVGVGFSKNIALRTAGFWHPNNTEEYGLDIDENQYLRSTNGFSLIGHLGLRLELSEKFGIYSRVRMKNQMSSLTSPSYGINQSYSLIGLEAGLISKF